MGVPARVLLNFIRPGKLVENAYVENFNGRFRDECLNEHWFMSMAHRRVIESWRIEYNTEGPHSSLGNLTPEEFAATGDPGPSPRPSVRLRCGRRR